MKATELIQQLTELVRIHGDRVVTIRGRNSNGWHEACVEELATIDSMQVFTEMGVCGCPGDDVPAFELKT